MTATTTDLDKLAERMEADLAAVNRARMVMRSYNGGWTDSAIKAAALTPPPNARGANGFLTADEIRAVIAKTSCPFDAGRLRQELAVAHPSKVERTNQIHSHLQQLMKNRMVVKVADRTATTPTLYRAAKRMAKAGK